MIVFKLWVVPVTKRTFSLSIRPAKIRVCVGFILMHGESCPMTHLHF